MIPHDVLVKIVNKMVSETGMRGIQVMNETVLGVPWKSVCDTVSANFGEPDDNHRHPSQLAMDFLMLGASIGYLYAKGESVSEIRQKQSDIAN